MISLRLGIILAALLLAASSPAATKYLTIVHTNDMHSHLQGFSPEIDYRPLQLNADETLGGWSRVASVIKKVRQEKKHPVLVLDAGDFSMGSLFHMLIREKAFELQLLKAMGYDALTLGNHEFDLKPAGLAAILETAKAKNALPPIVAANVRINRADPLLGKLSDAFTAAGVKPYIIIERDGLKIGIFGLLGKDAAAVSPFAKPLVFGDPVETAREMVRALREQEKADLVICLSHGGLRDNPKKSEDMILAKEVPGIDVIVGGHTHTKLDRPMVVGETLIVQAWCYGKQVGVLDLAYDEGKISLRNYAATAMDSKVAGDPDIQKMIEAFKQTINTDLLDSKRMSYDQVLAETGWDLFIKAEESPLGNLIADSIRWYVNAVDSDPSDPSSRVAVAVESNGIIRDDLIRGKTGKITLGDLFRTFPLGIGVDNTMTYPLVSFYLYGYEIKRATEILTSVRPLKNDDYYLQVSGLRLIYNPNRVIFDRVTAIEIGSEEEGYRPLDYSKANPKLYRVAANIYNASFLKMVGRFTYSLLDIVPKDKNGRPFDKLAEAVIDGDRSAPGVQELKEWQGLVKYVQLFPDRDGNGIPDMPAKYRGKLGRIVEKPELNPMALVSKPALPTWIVLGAFVLALLIIMLVASAVFRATRRKKI